MTTDEAPWTFRRGGVGDIQDVNGSVITDPQAPVNSGPGQQNNFQAGVQVHNHFGVIETIRRQVYGIVGTTEYLLKLRKVFVSPPAFAELAERLRPPGASLLLSGRTGCGRSATAQMLLTQTDETAPVVRQLFADDLIDRELLSVEDIEDGENLFLDLSEIDSETIGSLRNRILNCRSVAERQRARLVVAVGSDQEALLHGDWPGSTFELTRPDPWAVLSTHLEDSLSLSIRGQVSQQDEEVFEGLALVDVARVAIIMGRDRDHGDLAARFRRAIAFFVDHRASVSHLVRQHSDFGTRALIFAAALLEGSSIEAVFYAEKALAEKLKYRPVDEGHRLEQGGFIDRISGIGANEASELKVSPDRTVRFSQPAFGAAVLAHFWDAYPDLRKGFADWVSWSISSRWVTPGECIGVAERFAAMAAGAGGLQEIFIVAERLANAAGRSELRAAALAALNVALTNEQTEHKVRTYLYSSSRSPSLGSRFASVLIELCATSLVALQPQRALVRLRWFCDHPQVGGEAKQAIVSSCAAPKVLEAFLVMLMARDRDRFDPELFRLVCTPVRLTSGGPVPLATSWLRRKLVDGWRRAVGELGPSAWDSALTAWLDRHGQLISAADLRTARLLRQTLLAICADDVARLAQLYALNRTWLRDSREIDAHHRRQAAVAIERDLRAVLNRPIDQSPQAEGES